MTFRKNHKLGAKKFLDKPLDQNPITFKGYEGQREALKNVPNWQERFREFADKLIAESKLEGGMSAGRVAFPLRAEAAELPGIPCDHSVDQIKKFCP